MTETTAAEWIDAAKARCDAATAGPWRALADGTPDGDIYFVRAGRDRPFADVLVRGGDDGQYANGTAADAEFIAAARADLPAAIAALNGVLAVCAWYDDGDNPVIVAVRASIATGLGVDARPGVRR